ncbi:transposase [Streptomyces sp. NBC_01233]|uniref:transposase n=1 Tax=Streptomyces sp. NBC_01233 TaxID=2903787 RepID=UPI002E117FEB|nr:transposase [Streptomyces sp. NBC_01233]
MDKKRDLLELLDVQVVVTSEVPGALRSGGCLFESWFAREGRLVPPQLAEDQWSQVEHLFPQPKKQSRVVPPRLAFEASLYKVRHGLMWKDLPSAVTQGQRLCCSIPAAWFGWCVMIYRAVASLSCGRGGDVDVAAVERVAASAGTDGAGGPGRFPEGESADTGAGSAR